MRWLKATGWLPQDDEGGADRTAQEGIFVLERARDESKGSLYRIVEKPGAAIGA